MILDFDHKDKESSYSKESLGDLRDRLKELQLQCHLRDLSVIIVIDGWESSGKGYVINEISQELEAKHYSVGIFGEDDKDSYLISRELWEKLPGYGDFAIFDRSHYTRILWQLDMAKEDIDQNIYYLLKSEEALIKDRTLILKYFINIKKSKQRENIEKLAYDSYRSFMVDEIDIYQNLYYDAYEKHMDYILNKSNSPLAPWTIINGADLKEVSKEVLGKSINKIEERLEKLKKLEDEDQVSQDELEISRLKSPKILEKVPGDLKLNDKEYDDQLEDLQEKAGRLAYRIYKDKAPCVIVFEGVDAAGKGGAIQRLTRLMDPRSYKINPTSAPSDSEKDHHYLWRFYNNFPEKGDIAIFDRSWYGRVMVERVEKLTPVEDWSRAYGEINVMEKELVDSGAILLKFFISIDKDEQLERFEDRAEEKPHKLTDEDWRNREKWDENILAMDQMLDKTSSDYAPWHIIPGNQKKYARIQVLKTFIEEVEEFLGK